tara:strand:- start:2952 stop:3320 length:369 start_codon:yes stop_codon:yes gene_type:complete
MSKFKEGDRIVRISKPDSWVPIGYSSEVTCDYKYINVDGDYVTINEKVWQLEERHVHHDLIIAWAKGATIGYTNYMGHKLEPQGTPVWCSITKYHIVDSTPQTDAERITELEAKVKELEDRL